MFAEKLKELRKAKGLTQIQFALDFHVASGTVGMWETGRREPDIETTRRIADYFGVSVDYLLGREGRPEPSAGRAVTFDDFTYAMQNETRDLTDMDKQILLSMAKQLNDARKRKNGESG